MSCQDTPRLEATLKVMTKYNNGKKDPREKKKNNKLYTSFGINIWLYPPQSFFYFICFSLSLRNMRYYTAPNF